MKICLNEKRVSDTVQIFMYRVTEYTRPRWFILPETSTPGAEGEQIQIQGQVELYSKLCLKPLQKKLLDVLSLMPRTYIVEES